MKGWKLFLPDDPDTHPPLKQRVLLCDFNGVIEEPTPALLVKLQGELKWKGSNITDANKPMMWFPIPSIPKNPRIVSVAFCNDKSKSCEWCDDGYCHDKPEDYECDKVKIHRILLYD